MFVLIVLFLPFFMSAYTTLNELLVVFFIYNICGFLKL